MLAHQEEAERKEQKILETEKIQKKAKQLHDKQRQLAKQKEVVKDAKFEVAEEISKIRDDIKYSERALRIARRMKQSSTDHSHQKHSDSDDEDSEPIEHHKHHSKKAHKQTDEEQ